MLRYKGVLHMKGTDRKVIFQGVHQLMGSDLGPAWATQHPRDLIVVNAREDWRAPGPHPVIQQRFRSRWVQVWRASDWRALPAQQLPLQAAARQLRSQPR